MEEILYYILLGIVIFIIVIIINDKKKTKRKYENDNNTNYKKYYKRKNEYTQTNTILETYNSDEKNNIIEEQKYDIKTAYKRKKLLTEYEKKYYNYLANYAEKRNFQIISKIRLADLIEVDEKYSTRNIDKKISFSKISSKHIDFALCNKTDLEPILLIEVDDYTHNRPDRIERDKFIDKALRGAGYKIIHIKSLENLEKQLDYVTGVI